MQLSTGVPTLQYSTWIAFTSWAGVGEEGRVGGHGSQEPSSGVLLPSSYSVRADSPDGSTPAWQFLTVPGWNSLATFSAFLFFKIFSFHVDVFSLESLIS